MARPRDAAAGGDVEQLARQNPDLQRVAPSLIELAADGVEIGQGDGRQTELALLDGLQDPFLGPGRAQAFPATP